MSQVWAAYKWGYLNKRFPCDFHQISEYSEVISSEITDAQLNIFKHAFYVVNLASMCDFMFIFLLVYMNVILSDINN